MNVQLLSVVVVLGLAGAAGAGYVEDFESYSDGEQMGYSYGEHPGEWVWGINGGGPGPTIRAGVSHDGSNGILISRDDRHQASAGRLIMPEDIGPNGEYQVMIDILAKENTFSAFYFGDQESVLRSGSGGTEYYNTGITHLEGVPDDTPPIPDRNLVFGENEGPGGTFHNFSCQSEGPPQGFTPTCYPTNSSFTMDNWMQLLIEVDDVNANTKQITTSFRQLGDIDFTVGGTMKTYKGTMDAFSMRFYDTAGSVLEDPYVVDNIRILSGAVAADFDGDSDVDGDDFLAWQNGFPVFTGAALLDGDADEDGDVDGDDFLIWQNNFPYPAALSSVPEPNSLVLLALGGLMMRRRRQISLSW